MQRAQPLFRHQRKCEAQEFPGDTAMLMQRRDSQPMCGQRLTAGHTKGKRGILGDFVLIQRDNAA